MNLVWDSGYNISSNSGNAIKSHELGLGLWLQHQLQSRQCHPVGPMKWTRTLATTSAPVQAMPSSPMNLVWDSGYNISSNPGNATGSHEMDSDSGYNISSSSGNAIESHEMDSGYNISSSSGNAIESHEMDSGYNISSSSANAINSGTEMSVDMFV